MKFRWQIILLLLPFAIIPVLVIALYSGITLFNYLTRQTFTYYDTILTQVSSNINSTYNTYAMTFSDITMMENFHKYINGPPYKSAIEERMMHRKIGEWGNNPEGNTLRRAAMAKIDGEFYIIELDRRSIQYNTDYKIHKLSLGDIVIDIKMLLQDPLMNELKKNPKNKLIFGLLQTGILSGYETDYRSVFIYPFYKEGAETFVEFIITVMDIDFLRSMYQDIDNLKYGTLYITDRNGSILSFNHPNSRNDIYEYDPVDGKYLLGDDELYDDFEKMSFQEYSMLITDQTILEAQKVKDIINDYKNSNNEDSDRIINKVMFKGREYLMIIREAQDAECMLLYFHPVKQILEPIYHIVTVIVSVAIFLIIGALVLSFILSKIVTNPIKQLTIGANRISSGNYNYSLDTRIFSGEFLVLGNSFNNMSSQINNFKNHMEKLVQMRTQQLQEKTEELQITYEKLQCEHENNTKELQIAQKIQQALIPTIFPQNKIINLLGLYYPMDKLGGDLFDVYKISDTRIDVLIIDVVGHGVPAALVTTMAKISFYNNSKKYDAPDKILRQVNIEMVETLGQLCLFFTAFYGIIDVVAGTIKYSNASHPPAIIIHNDSIQKLQPNSAFIGVKKNIAFKTDEIPISNNDRIILITDGVTEARNQNDEMYTEERLIKSILKLKDKSLNSFVKKLYEQVKRFTDKNQHDDDIAILVGDIIINESDVNLDPDNG